LPHFSHILAKFTYRIFSPHILAFSEALNILCSNFSDADDLLLQEVEEVVADGTEFVESQSEGPFN